MKKTRAIRLVELENGNRPLEELLREWLQEMPTREIAEKCGVHVTLVYDWMEELKIPTRSQMRYRSAEGVNR